MTRPRSFWRVSAAEARAHAAIAAVVLWAVAFLLLTSGTRYRDPFGQLKWTDFVHFYTLGHVAREGPVSDLYDPEALHRRQVSLVPASASERYPPVYPPQMAILFAPLSGLGYLTAAAVWAVVSAGVYGATIWIAWRPARAALPDWVLVTAAAAAFPPFWSLILNGQTTAVPILAFSGAAMALARGRKVLAGAALGVLLMKPQFGLMVALVVLVCREWSLLAGLAISAVAQAGLVVMAFGAAVLQQYTRVVLRFPSLFAAFESSPAQRHSLVVVTQLLPSPVSTVVWLATSAWATWLVIQVWRSTAIVNMRMAALIMGSVLLNLHLYLYDVSVLAVPLVWIAVWLETDAPVGSEVRARWYLATYVLFICLLAPPARIFWLPLSPFVVLWFLYSVARPDVLRSSKENPYGR